MKILLLTLCGMLAAGELFAQISLPYTVDFSTDIPSNWYQGGGSSASWEWSSHGKSAPGSALVDLSDQGDRFTVRIETPALDFSSTTDPVLRFDAAFTRNNFVAPAISVWYSSGDDWKLLDSWGEVGLADLTPPNHLLEGGSDYVPPLDAENIRWHTLTADLSSLAGESGVKFAFQAELPNGGYVLMDEVEFTSAVAGVEEEQRGRGLQISPNPATQTLEIKSSQPFARVAIVDLLGRSVLEREGSAGNLHLDISGLPAGSYWLQLIDDNGLVRGRRSFVKR